MVGGDEGSRLGIIPPGTQTSIGQVLLTDLSTALAVMGGFRAEYTSEAEVLL